MSRGKLNRRSYYVKWIPSRLSMRIIALVRRYVIGRGPWHAMKNVDISLNIAYWRYVIKRRSKYGSKIKKFKYAINLKYEYVILVCTYLGRIIGPSPTFSFSFFGDLILIYTHILVTYLCRRNDHVDHETLSVRYGFEKYIPINIVVNKLQFVSNHQNRVTTFERL